MKRKLLLALLLLLVVIQFIRPVQNQSSELSPNDISHQYSVPANVNVVLKKACNDCHSNNTVYPWYNRIQPVAWWLSHHIENGKEELNFSEFASYTPKKQHHKLEEVTELVKNGEMPLNSYTWVHKNAILTDGEKRAITEWADNLRTEIRAAHNLPEKDK